MGIPMSFWEVHGIFGGIFLLISVTIFPRITLFFILPFSFTWLQWGLFLFIPRFWAAYLGTKYYWDTNPILCIIAWIIALGILGGEAKGTNNNDYDSAEY